MSTRLPRWRRMLVVAAATLTSVTAATAAAALEPGGATDAPPPTTTEAPQPPAPDTEVPAVPIDDVEVTAPPVVDDPEIAPEIAPDDEVTAPEAGPVPADDPDPADDPAPAATVPTTAPAASPASHEGGATFLVNGQPFHGQDDPKLEGCTITLSITEADDASHQATGAIRAVEPSGAATLVSFDEAFEGTSWSQSWPLDALVGDLEQKPNGYRIQIDLELDDEGQQTSRRFWLACGADQEGNPYVVVLDKQWQAPDGTVLDGPPADLPEDWRLTATSKLGTATCSYPPGGTELVCTYENKG
ncbi:MAG: hypothetical protein KDA98_17595, partial [Acidimicrobiales bacterium]|nr:hypothetical protein [Acidimicrobiales bacterium]